MDSVRVEWLMGFLGIVQIEGHEVKENLESERDRDRGKRVETVEPMIYEGARFPIDRYRLSPSSGSIPSRESHLLEDIFLASHGDGFNKCAWL